MPFVSQKDLDELKRISASLQTDLEKLKRCSFLIGIERTGRINKFTFARGDELYVVETCGLLSDNLPEWKEKLLR